MCTKCDGLVKDKLPGMQVREIQAAQTKKGEKEFVKQFQTMVDEEDLETRPERAELKIADMVEGTASLVEDYDIPTAKMVLNKYGRPPKTLKMRPFVLRQHTPGMSHTVYPIPIPGTRVLRVETKVGVGMYKHHLKAKQHRFGLQGSRLFGIHSATLYKRLKVKSWQRVPTHRDIVRRARKTGIEMSLPSVSERFAAARASSSSARFDPSGQEGVLSEPLTSGDEALADDADDEQGEAGESEVMSDDEMEEEDCDDPASSLTSAVSRKQRVDSSAVVETTPLKLSPRSGSEAEPRSSPVSADLLKSDPEEYWIRKMPLSTIAAFKDYSYGNAKQQAQTLKGKMKEEERHRLETHLNHALDASDFPECKMKLLTPPTLETKTSNLIAAGMEFNHENIQTALIRTHSLFRWKEAFPEGGGIIEDKMEAAIQLGTPIRYDDATFDPLHPALSRCDLSDDKIAEVFSDVLIKGPIDLSYRSRQCWRISRFEVLRISDQSLENSDQKRSLAPRLCTRSKMHDVLSMSSGKLFCNASTRRPPNKFSMMRSCWSKHRCRRSSNLDHSNW